MIVIKNVMQNGVPVSLSIEGVGVHGLLFESKAAKTAWLSLLAGVSEPEEGEVLLYRKDCEAPAISQKRYIGYVPEVLPLYEDMTVLELLNFIGTAKGVAPDRCARQIKEALELMGLTNLSHRLIASLSVQNRRRVAFAQAVLGNPSVIICDDPFAGANAEQKRDLEALLRMLGRHKPIVVGSTTADILPLCTDVTVLDADGVRFSDAADALLASLADAGKETAMPASVADYFGFAEEQEEDER